MLFWQENYSKKTFQTYKFVQNFIFEEPGIILPGLLDTTTRILKKRAVQCPKLSGELGIFFSSYPKISSNAFTRFSTQITSE